jgi:hypothetical protein
VLLPDPVYAFGAPSQTGIEAIAALGLTLEARPHLVVSGDIHHYRREHEGPTVHVTAGGGGAFLHPAALDEAAARPAASVWPSAAQSRLLLWQVPLKLALGRSGIIPHLVLLVTLLPVASVIGPSAFGLAACVTSTVILAAVLRLVAGVRKSQSATGALALGSALLTTASCVLARELAERLLGSRVEGALLSVLVSAFALLCAVPIGALLFGLYLSLLTHFGYEPQQAFAALDHPGFKHFVRFRVHADGSAVDAFCIGLVDPARAGEPPVLVDAFRWRSR